jgi:hypothetical protein
VAATVGEAVVVDAAVTAAEVVAVAVEDAEGAVTVEGAEVVAAIANSHQQNFIQSERARTPCAPVPVFVAPACPESLPMAGSKDVPPPLFAEQYLNARSQI